MRFIRPVHAMNTPTTSLSPVAMRSLCAVVAGAMRIGPNRRPYHPI